MKLQQNLQYLNFFINSTIIRKKQSFLIKLRKLQKYKPGQLINVSYLYPTRDGLKVKQFLGLCLGLKSRNFNSIILLRNSFRSTAIEYKFLIYSPLLLSLTYIYTYRKKVRLAKIYYIRTLRQKTFIKK
jgi:ribosomal protein L19